MDLVYLFRVLLKRKWIIIGSAFLAALIAWYFTRNEPKTYKSSTRISTGFAIQDEIKVNDNFSIFDADVKFNNAINTLNSPAVITLLCYKLILHDFTSPAPFRRLTNNGLQSSIYKTVDKEAARKTFEDKLETMSVLTSYKPDEKKLLEFLNLYGYSYKNISAALNIYQVPRTDFLQIDYQSENPELSAFVVNNLFQEFLRYYRGIRSSKSQESIDTLQSIMEKKKQEWDDKLRLLRGEGGMSTGETTSQFGLIADLERALQQEKNKQTDDYYALRKINQQLAAQSGTASTTNPKATSTNEELITARKAMNEAYAQYLKTNDKSDLAKYNQLRSEYNTKYANSTDGVSSGATPVTDNATRNNLLTKKNDLEVEFEASNAKIDALTTRINSLKQTVSATNSKSAGVETLTDEAKLAERDYLDAKSKYSNALDQNTSAINNFRQLQIAQPAIEPEPSKRQAIIGLAGTITLLSAILIIVLLTYLDSSVKTPIIFSKKVNLKLISMVNFMNMKEVNLKDMVAGTAQPGNHQEKLRNNVFRESIRKLRFEIETSGKKIFLFTSTKKGMGKTTLIQALAYSMSISKKKILIIDTNFCNNDLTVQLNADPVLEKISTDKNNRSLVDQIKFLSKDIGAGTVFAIGSEGGDYTPSEVLPRENLLNHLQSLTAEFDYIFLEGPPLNDFSDSKELIQYVDSVVAIFSATHIIKQIDKESIKFLKELNGKFCGSVLNKVDLENVNTI
jgi:uncharacterized protein involved in exopolysaccharide biosynthesis/Mrp family chromosome partitioning ATPase